MKIKNVVVTGQNEVELQEAELDENLRPNDLLIETEATYISSGTELANYTGVEPKTQLRGQWCSYPWKSGYANVGMVRAAGAAVSRAQVGDRVFTYANHTSHARYDASRLVVQVPGGMDSATAAASRMTGVAVTALLVADLRDNPWVAVYGLGMVGNQAAQAFRIRGFRVIGVDPVQKRREIAEQCGVTHTVGGTPDEAHAAIREITRGSMAGVSVDAVGHGAVCAQALKATSDHGQLIILGSPRAPVETNITEFLSDVHLRWISVRGALEWMLPMYPTVGRRPSQYTKQRMIFDWMERGELQLEPLISHRMKPEQIKQAYDGLRDHPETYTGVALEWR